MRACIVNLQHRLFAVVGSLLLAILPSTSLAQQLCSDTSTVDASGSLQDSGGSSKKYGSNEYCQFVIQPTSGGDITLSFSSFDYETGDDFLRIYDGISTGSTLLGSFTGTSLPADVTATSGAMLVEHSSEGTVPRDGFTADWSSGSTPVNSCPAQSVADSFPGVSYSQNNGTENWTTSWLEVGENDGPSSGIVRVSSTLCGTGDCLRIGGPGIANSWSNRGALREADLSSAGSATLTFNYYSGASRDSETVTLAVSNNGGTSWTTLQTYNITSTNLSPTAQSFDLSSHISANTQIRFLSSASNAVTSMSIDDLKIQYDVTCPPSDPVTDWHLDESGYTGASSEVVDSSASAFNAVAFGGAGTISDGQVCRAMAFDGTDDYYQAGSFSAPLRSTGSLSFWIQTSQLGDALVWQSPGVTGSELSSSADDIHWGFINNNGQIGVGPGDVNHSLSTTIIADGSWHHVVHTRDSDTGILQTFVDGTLESTTTSATGTISQDFSSIGRIEDSAGSHEYLDGNLDEVMIFDSVLSADNVQTIYTNQLAAMNWDGSERVCNNPSASAFILSHDRSGIHCLAEPISVSAVDSVNTLVPSYVGSITLDTQSGDGTWTLSSGSGTLTDATSNDGLATYQFSAADNGAAVFGLDYNQGTRTINVDAYQTNQTTIRDTDSEGDITFAPSGFVVTANALSNPPPNPINDPITSQTAGTDFPVYLTAYGTSTTDAQCGVIESYTGSSQLKFWTQYNSPSSGTLTASINGSSSGASLAAASAQAVSFSNGQAVVTANYKDVGIVGLGVEDQASFSNTLAGASNNFVSRPADLAITQITDPSGDANPAATSMIGSAFVAAGTSFRVVVTARDATGSTTPNFGLETAAENIRLRSSNLVAPSGGRNGSSGDINSGTSFTRTAAGTFTATSLSFDEIGIIQLQAEVGDGDYQGSGALLGNQSGNVGRFYPASFVMTSDTLTAACGTFSYQGQPELSAAFTIEARNLGGTLVQNYDAGLLSSGTLAGLAWAAENADSGTDLGGRLTAVSASWTAGRLQLNTSALSFSRTATPDGPYDSLQLGLTLLDVLDSAILAGINQNAGATGSCASASNCLSQTIGSATQIRYGRLAVLPGSAPEDSVLDVALSAEYFDGSAFRAHPQDQCSAYASVDTTLSAFVENLSSGETAVVAPSPSTTLLNGSARPTLPLRLSAPGVGNAGGTTLTLDVPSWLEFPWTGAGMVDPSASQQFGTYRGHDRIVSWDEQTR
jgi:MSHA biogenesis protein MshQ